MLSTNIPDELPLNPQAVTAQTIYDALSVSPYMDHIVDCWIEADSRYRIADALVSAAVVAQGGDLMDAIASIDPALYEQSNKAREYLNKTYAEVVERFNYYRDKVRS